jgi:hypothetical protein
MSLTTKRMIFIAAMAAIMGFGGYKYLPGSMHERRLTGVIGLMGGYVIGRFVAPMVFPDASPPVDPAGAVTA